MFTENFSLTGLTGTFIRQGVIRTIRYDEGSATGGVTPTLRVTSLQGSKVDFEMKPGRIVNLTEPLNGLVIKNASTGANITGKISYGDGQVTDNTTTGSVDLNTNTITALTTAPYNVRPEAANGFYASLAAITANTPFEIFTAAANVNGAVLLDAHISAYDNATACIGAFVAKATPPANIMDGEVMLSSKPSGNAGSAPSLASPGQLTSAQFIPAGKALYYIASASLAANAGQHRACRYKLL